MTQPRVFATADIGSEALERLRQKGYQLEVYPKIEAPPKALILERVRAGVDALITTLRDPIDEEVFAAGEGTLKVVAQDAVGFDNIDREAANRHGIPFTNTAEVLTDATAEFAFFLMGCVSRKLYPSERIVRENRWKTWHPYHPILGDEVTGKTVGVVGTGRIGRAFAIKCAGLGMHIRLHDPVAEDAAFAAALAKVADTAFEAGLFPARPTVAYVDLDELLSQSDYITLHVPLTPETRHLMNRETLSRMKPGAYLINTSRGPVVEEAALVEALRSGHLGGAALDVFEQEPLPVDSPLRDPELEERVRLFHHFASAGRRTRLSPDPTLGMAGRCVQGVIDVLEGRYGGNPAEMPYVVNKEAFH